jgi:hypothetical protein
MIRAKDLSISFSGHEIFSEGNFIINRSRKSWAELVATVVANRLF